MNMNLLLSDFKKYVDSMDEHDVRRSIADAITHTSNSYILDGVAENNPATETKSSTQIFSTTYNGAENKFSFCSVDISSSGMSYEMFSWEDIAA